MTGPEVLGFSVQTPLIEPSLSVFWQVSPRNGQRFAVRAWLAAFDTSAGAYPKNSTILLANGLIPVLLQVTQYLLGNRFGHDDRNRVANLNILRNP